KGRSAADFALPVLVQLSGKAPGDITGALADSVERDGRLVLELGPVGGGDGADVVGEAGGPRPDPAVTRGDHPAPRLDQPGVPGGDLRCVGTTAEKGVPVEEDLPIALEMIQISGFGEGEDDVQEAAPDGRAAGDDLDVRGRKDDDSQLAEA